MFHPNRRLLLAAFLAGLAVPGVTAPALAALPGADFPLDVTTDTAVPAQSIAATDAPAPVRLADNDDDDDGRRFLRRGGDDDRRRAARRGGDDDDDDEDDDDDDDDDDECDDDDGNCGRMAPRRTGPAPAQNPLIGAPRAVVN